MLTINRHKRDILDMRADARMLDLANRSEPADAPAPDYQPGLTEDHYRDSERVSADADAWYGSRPTVDR